MISLRYPVLFVHGMGFRDRKRLCYWGRIPRAFEKEGIRVYFGGQDSNGSIEDNAAFLANRIASLSKSEGIEKFHVFAHSKGGLDMRCALRDPEVLAHVASITTFATPHNGSKTMDAIFSFFPRPILAAGCAVADVWFAILGDKKPRTFRAISAFTTEEAEAFNQAYPAPAGIPCRSCAFVCKNAASDVFLALPYLIVRHFDGDCDGLLPPRAAIWEEFAGTLAAPCQRGISHLDEIDFRRRALKKGTFDVVDFYLEQAAELERRGL